MARYLGMSTSYMLNNLMMQCQTVRLESLGDELGFKLLVDDPEHGKREFTGPLTYVLGNACKPYIEQWKARDQKLSAEFSALQKRIATMQNRTGGE